MTDTDEFLTVGHIRKAHGLKGEVVVRLTTNRAERVAEGALLLAGDRELVVKSSRPKDADYLVLFEGVTQREHADELRGTELRAEPIDDPDELWVHEVIGAVVIDRSGTERGKVVEVEANPASDLFVLDNEALVPATFVTGFEPATEDTRAELHVDTPDGLFDLL